MQASLFNNDARQQIWILYPSERESFIENDYIRSYYTGVFLPAGYQALYRSLAPLFDPAGVSKVLPPLLLIVLLVLSALTARGLGGHLAMAATGTLVLASGYPLWIMAAALPRAFGLPIFALGVLAVMTRRPWLLSVSVIAGAAFYPSVALPLALTLTVLMIIGKRVDFFADLSIRARILLLVCTGLAAVAVVFPSWKRARAYGEPVTLQSIARYPEAAAGGRYSPGNHPPFSGALEELDTYVTRALTNGLPLLPGSRPEQVVWRGVIISLGAILLIGTVLFAKRSAAGKRIALMLCAIIAAYMITTASWPLFFFPERQVSSTVPVLVWILLPIAAAQILGSVKTSVRVQQAGIVVVTALSVLLVGGRIAPRAGLDIEIAPDTRLYTFLSHLPESSLIAGFPSGAVDNVPYLARHSALVTFETHQAFHTGYLTEMRRRTAGVIDAYFATDLVALKRLHHELGVTHLIVQRSHFDQEPPSYFKPFSDRVRRAHSRGRASGFQVLRFSGPEVVFREGEVMVLELSKIAGTDGDDQVVLSRHASIATRPHTLPAHSFRMTPPRHIGTTSVMVNP